MIRVLCSLEASGARKLATLASAQLQQAKFLSSVQLYLSLSKVKLNTLVLGTTLGTYFLASNTFGMAGTSHIAGLAAGTLLCSFSAASLNQCLEVEQDALMNRTKGRALPTKRLSKTNAIQYATAAGVTGGVLLLGSTNLATAALGVTNILIYSFLYTPMKRISHWNTWVGSVVGSIPPLMGVAACHPSLLCQPSAYLPSLLLFFWQFPHFFSLSWRLKSEYLSAGYKMLSIVDPIRCRCAPLLYSCCLPFVSILFFYTGYVDWTFLASSNVLNAGLIFLSHRFSLQSPEEKLSLCAKRLFLFTLAFLPLQFFLLILNSHRKRSKSATQDADLLL